MDWRSRDRNRSSPDRAGAGRNRLTPALGDPDRQAPGVDLGAVGQVGPGVEPPARFRWPLRSQPASRIRLSGTPKRRSYFRVPSEVRIRVRPRAVTHLARLGGLSRVKVGMEAIVRQVWAGS